MYFYLLSLLILILDQILKQLVCATMRYGQSIVLIKGVLSLTYVRNTGAAFSLFMGYSAYLILIGFAAALTIFYFHLKVSSRDYYFQTALAFVLGGSLGNLMDRLLRSYVVDYLDVGFWPVFNLADIMINVGVLLIIIRLIQKEEADASGSS